MEGIIDTPFPLLFLFSQAFDNFFFSMFVFFYGGGGGCWVGTFVVLRVVTHYKIFGIKTFNFFLTCLRAAHNTDLRDHAKHS